MPHVDVAEQYQKDADDENYEPDVAVHFQSPSLWWAGKDSNLRRRQGYSLL